MDEISRTNDKTPVFLNNLNGFDFAGIATPWRGEAQRKWPIFPSPARFSYCQQPASLSPEARCATTTIPAQANPDKKKAGMLPAFSIKTIPRRITSG
jgi:hypothetical protein